MKPDSGQIKKKKGGFISVLAGFCAIVKKLRSGHYVYVPIHKTSALMFLLPLLFFFASCAHVKPEHDVVFSHIYDEQNHMVYPEADPENGGYSQDITDKKSMDSLAGRSRLKRSLISPLFPTVYSPGNNLDADVGYYKYLLRESGIKENEKVLVVGSGSGADSWAAWLKTRVRVYAIDINPLAVANTKAAARSGGFQVKAIAGDVNSVSWPKGFSDFDYILWNMPFLTAGNYYKEQVFHDGDKGVMVDKFLTQIPELLKPNGKASLLNTRKALERVKWADKEIVKSPYSPDELYIIIIKNPGKG